MRFKFTSILVLFFFCTYSLHAQFELLVATNQDQSVWKIKYTGSDSVKLNSATLEFFHQHGDMDFTPALTFPGGGKYQYTGNFRGAGSMQFRYKTIQLVALDSQLKNGQEAVLSISRNTGNIKDTILAAGVKVFFTKNSTSLTAQAFPENALACPSDAVYVNAGTSGAGIKQGSFAAQNLHSGNCLPGIVAIVFDNHSLLRKPVTNVNPACANGKKWTTWGNATDYQVYYSFDITTQQGRMGFDSFINQVSQNDFVAITNSNMISLRYLDSVQTSLKKLGYPSVNMGDTLGYLTMTGKKGANPGEASVKVCKDPHMSCSVSTQQVIVSDDADNFIRDFAVCYESMVQYLSKTTIHVKSVAKVNPIPVWPNPANMGWNLPKSVSGFGWILTDLNGKELKTGNAAFIPANDLREGIYLLLVQDKNANPVRMKLMKN